MESEGKSMKIQKRRSILFTGLLICLICAAMWKPSVIRVAAADITLSVKNGEDITGKLQRALSEAADLKTGTCRIKIPKGKYKLKDQLQVYSNTHVVMNGVTLVRTNVAGSNSMVRLSSTTSGECTGYGGFTNITFEGGTWDDNGSTGAIMRFGHANKITLKNVTFTNVKNKHHVEIAACRDVLITGCTFKNFMGNWDSKTNYEALQFDIMKSNHFSGYPEDDETPCRDITVTGCTFKKVQRGMGTHSAIIGSYFENMNFTDNTFSNIAGYAIICTNYRNSTVSGNKITDAGSGIFYRTMSKNHAHFYSPEYKKGKVVNNTKSVISGNTIEVSVKAYGNVAFGLELYGEKLTKKTKNIPKGDYRLSGLTVTGNKITMNCNGYGMRLTHVNKCIISGNSISMNMVKKNPSGGNGDGIRLQGSVGNTIKGNRINNKKRNSASKKMCGITVLSNSDNTVLKGNTVTGCSVNGIMVKNSAGVTVSTNKVSKNGKYGINITNNSRVKASGNSVKNNGLRDLICSGGAKVNGKSSF